MTDKRLRLRFTPMLRQPPKENFEAICSNLQTEAAAISFDKSLDAFARCA